MDTFNAILLVGVFALSPLFVTSTPPVACPSPFGAFPDISDCSGYIQCVNSAPFHRKCPAGTAFDLIQHRCRPSITVSCGLRGAPTQSTPILVQTHQTEPPVQPHVQVLTGQGIVAPGGINSPVPNPGGVILGPFNSNTGLPAGYPQLGTSQGQYPLNSGFPGPILGPFQSEADILNTLGYGGGGAYPLGALPGALPVNTGMRPSYSQPVAIVPITSASNIALDTSNCKIIEETMNQVLIELIKNMCGTRCDPTLIPSLKVVCQS